MGTFTVHTLAVNGNNGLGHADEFMEVCRQSQSGVVRLQEMRRDGHLGFTAASFTVYCSGTGGGDTEPNGQHAVGIAIYLGVDLAGCREG